MREPENGFTEVDGLRLHHLDWGGSGAPVVCLHGLTGNAHAFDGLARSLGLTLRILSLDVRGRGDSEWGPPEGYQLPRYVADLGIWLDALHLDRVALVGTSMGGIISMLFAAAQPDRVERVALNDIGPVGDPRGLERIRGYVGTAPERFPELKAAAGWFRENYPGIRASDEQLLELAGHAVRELPEGGFGWKYDRAIRQAMNEPAAAAAAAPELWPIAEALPGPTLVLRGGISDILAADTASEMTRRMKDCRAVDVPGVGHAPLLSEPEALRALRGFFGVE
jgi:pimeloyl-ACP methyl ester carboxylesterase